MVWRLCLIFAAACLLTACSLPSANVDENQRSQIFHARGQGWKVTHNSALNRLLIEVQIGTGAAITKPAGPILSALDYPLSSGDFDKVALEWLSLSGYRACEVSRDPAFPASELSMSFVYFCRS